MVSITLLLKVVSELQGSIFFDRLGRIAWLHICLALIFNSVAMFGGMIRWVFLLHLMRFKLTHFQSFKLYFVASLINQAVPSIVGGDSYRIIGAVRINQANDSLVGTPSEERSHFGVSFLATFFDRLLGLFSLLLLGSITLWVVGDMIGEKVNSFGVLVMCALMFMLFITKLLVRLKFFQNMVSKLSRRSDFFVQFVCEILLVRRISFLVFSGLVIHICSIFSLYFCFRAIGTYLPIMALSLCYTAVSLLSLIPITIGGWGVRELTISGILVVWGVSSEQSILASVIFGLVNVASVLPAAYWLFQDRQSSLAT